MYRRGDYLRHLASFGGQPVGLNYLDRAMSRVKTDLGKVAFVMVTDDIPWAR